jgi:ABC-type multidrug transport system ATPase subunit
VQIILEDIGKKYENNWLFRHLNTSFEQNRSYAIIGDNGSGKSTLLKILANGIEPSEGNIVYSIKDISILDQTKIAQSISFAAPYMLLSEDFTLSELLNYRYKFSSLIINIQEFIEYSYLQPHQNKRIKNFSSGMKQRLKLALAIFANTPILMLDEPCSNLDEKAKQWYTDMIDNYSKNRLTIIASNDKREYENCDILLNINDLSF